MDRKLSRDNLQESSTPYSADERFRRDVISKIGFWLGIVIFLAIGPRYLIAQGATFPLFRALAIGSLLFTLPYLIRKNFSTTLCCLLLILSICGLAMSGGFANGGLKAPVTVLFVFTPVLGFFCLGQFGALVGLIMSALGILTLVWADANALVEPLNSPERYVYYKAFIDLTALTAAYVLGSIYERSRKLASKRLEELTLKSAQTFKMASLGQMAAGIAHEINNPLAIVAGSAGLLKKLSSDPAKFAAKVEAIEHSSLRISKIVRGLEKFSRSSEFRYRTNRILSDIVQDTLTLTDAKSRQHDTEVIYNHSSQSRASISCDDVEIEQVLINLINNSVDAVKNKNVRWIKLEVTDHNNKVILRITDSGTGIPKNDQSRIFEPFFTTARAYAKSCARFLMPIK